MEINMFPKDFGKRVLELAANSGYLDSTKTTLACELLSKNDPDAEREFVEVAFKMAQSVLIRFQDELKWVYEQMKNKESEDA